jgi:hypothetical protein
MQFDCGALCNPLCGGEAVPSDGDGLCSVLRNTLALIKHDAQLVLSACMPLCRCKAVGHGDTHKDSKFIHTNSHLASCQERNVRDVMRVRELRAAMNLLPKRDEITMLNKSASKCAATSKGIVGCAA